MALLSWSALTLALDFDFGSGSSLSFSFTSSSSFEAGQGREWGGFLRCSLILWKASFVFCSRCENNVASVESLAPARCAHACHLILTRHFAAPSSGLQASSATRGAFICLRICTCSQTVSLGRLLLFELSTRQTQQWANFARIGRQLPVPVLASEWLQVTTGERPDLNRSQGKQWIWLGHD